MRRLRRTALSSDTMPKPRGQALSANRTETGGNVQGMPAWLLAKEGLPSLVTISLWCGERLRSTTRTNTTCALKRRTLKMKLNRRRVGQDKRRVSRLARCPADMNSGHVHESKSPRSRSELLTAGFVVSGSTPSPRLTHRVT